MYMYEADLVPTAKSSTTDSINPNHQSSVIRGPHPHHQLFTRMATITVMLPMHLSATLGMDSPPILDFPIPLPPLVPTSNINTTPQDWLKQTPPGDLTGSSHTTHHLAFAI